MNLPQAAALDGFSIFPGDWNIACNMGQLAILGSQQPLQRLTALAGTSSICLLFTAGKRLPGIRTTKDSQQVIESKGPGDASEGVSEGLESCPSCNQLNKYLPQKRIKARKNE